MSNEEFIQDLFIKSKSVLSQQEQQVLIDFNQFSFDDQRSAFEWLLSLSLSDEIKNNIRDYCYIEVARSIVTNKAKQHIEEFTSIVEWLFSQRLSVKELCLSFGGASESWVDIENYDDLLMNMQCLQKLSQYTSELEPYCKQIFAHITNFTMNIDKGFDIFNLLSLHSMYSGCAYYIKSIETHIECVFREFGKKLIARKEILEYHKLSNSYKDTMNKELFNKNPEYEALIYHRIKKIISNLPKNERKIPIRGNPMQDNKVSILFFEMEIMVVFNFMNNPMSCFKAFSEIVSMNIYFTSTKGILFTNIMVELENNCFVVALSVSKNESFGKSEIVNSLKELSIMLPSMMIDYN